MLLASGLEAAATKCLSFQVRLALLVLLAGEVVAVATGTCLVVGSALVRWYVEMQLVALHWIL